MAKLVLAGGTDVAEMALFSLDALRSDRLPEGRALESMEEQGVLMRFPTGADGAYLLHAYVDEVIPEELRKYCVEGDAKKGRLRLASGRMGFGGSESLVGNFKPNEAADSSVPPDDYEVTAFRTDFPDELIEAAIEGKLGLNERKLLNLPAKIIGIAVVLSVVGLLMKAFLAVAAIVSATFVGLRYLFFKNPKIQRLECEKESIEANYPSIIVEMRSANRRTG